MIDTLHLKLSILNRCRWQKLFKLPQTVQILALLCHQIYVLCILLQPKLTHLRLWCLNC